MLFGLWWQCVLCVLHCVVQCAAVWHCSGSCKWQCIGSCVWQCVLCGSVVVVVWCNVLCGAVCCVAHCVVVVVCCTGLCGSVAVVVWCSRRVLPSWKLAASRQLQLPSHQPDLSTIVHIQNSTIVRIPNSVRSTIVWIKNSVHSTTYNCACTINFPHHKCPHSQLYNCQHPQLCPKHNSPQIQLSTTYLSTAQMSSNYDCVQQEMCPGTHRAFDWENGNV